MHSDAMPPEIETLWEEFLARPLSDADSATLLSWLEKHPSALPQKRREAAMSAALEYMFASRASSARLVESVQARLKGRTRGGKSGRFSTGVMAQIEKKAAAIPRRARRGRVFSHSSGMPLGLVAALVIVLLGGLLLLTNRPKNDPETPLKVVVAQKTPTSPTTPAAVATLLVKQGDVSVDGARANGSAALKELSNVSTQSGARATVTLADKSTFELAESTTLSLQPPQNGPRLKLSSGVVDVQASPQSAGTNLQIETSQATVKVIGTRFTVNASSAQSWVGVSEGNVTVIKNGTQAAVKGGEEIIADSRGLSSVWQSGSKREIALNQAKVEVFTDPVKIEVLSGKAFQNMPIQRFSYRRPAKDALNYGGAFWPLSLAPHEDRFEVWLKPSYVNPIPRDYNLLKVCLMLNCGESQYMIGEVEVRPANRDWIRLEGRLENAVLNWTRPGAPATPLTPSTVTEAALRVIMGEADFEHTPVRIYSSRKQ